MADTRSATIAGTIDREAEGYAATHRVPDDDRVPQVERLEDGRCVVDETREPEHRRHRGGAAEAALVNRDHPTTASQQGGCQERERPHRRAMAVQEQHGMARAALLDVKVTAVRGRDQARLCSPGS